MPKELASVNWEEVRGLARRICQEMNGQQIPNVQAALVLSYAVIAGALEELPEEEVASYGMAMISQVLSALPPVIEEVRNMTPEELKLVSMPVEGTS